MGTRGAAAAFANAVYDATGVRVRNYPITLGMPPAATPVLEECVCPEAEAT